MTAVLQAHQIKINGLNANVTDSLIMSKSSKYLL